MSDSLQLDYAEVLEATPYAPPFLFLDEATLGEQFATGIYKIKGDEPVLEGHLAHKRIFPASLASESLGQLGVLYLVKNATSPEGKKVDLKNIVFTSADGIRAHRICNVGETLELEIKIKRLRYPMIQLGGKITVNGEKAFFVEQITLAFDWA